MRDQPLDADVLESIRDRHEVLDLSHQLFVLLATSQREVSVASMSCFVINEPANGTHFVLVVINTQRNRGQVHRLAIRHGLITTDQNLKVLVPIEGTSIRRYLVSQLVSAYLSHTAPPITRLASPSSACLSSLSAAFNIECFNASIIHPLPDPKHLL